MSIITISRGSYSRGKEIAEKVAQKLGYQCIARETIIEASEQFNTPEIKLVRAIHNAPSILDRFAHGKDKYIVYFQASLLKCVLNDNVVYHGLAGHFLLRGISHVLKVRIISDWDDRVALEMERENILREEAANILKSDDEQRLKWSQALYGIDTTDSSLYDLVVNIRAITSDDAANIICNSVRLPHFQTTAQSQKVLEDRLLACDVKAALVAVKPDVDVYANGGVVFVDTSGPLSIEKSLTQELVGISKHVPGIKDIHIDVRPKFPI